MDKKAVVAGLLPALMLYACDRAAAPLTPEGTAPAPETSPPAPGSAQQPQASEAPPGLAPSPLTPEAEKGAKGARNVLLSFARAIELGEFDQAWAMLGPGDRQRLPKAAFTRQLGDLSKITVAAPGGTIEGACGSSYYTAPITLTATDRSGRPVRYEGEAVLRRVNDVDGATPAQLRWHFDRLSLDWTH